MGKFDSPIGNTNFSSKEGRHFTVDDASGPDVEEQQFESSNSVIPPEYRAQYEAEIARQRAAQQAQASAQARSQHSPQGQPQHPQGQPMRTAQGYAQNPPQMQEREVSWEEAQRIREQFARSRQDQGINRQRSMVEVLIGIGRKHINVPIYGDDGVATYTVSTLKSKERKHVARAKDELYKLKTQEALLGVRTVTLAYCITAVDGVDLDTILNTKNIHPDERYAIREAFVEELDDNVTTFLFERFEKLDQDNLQKYSVRSEEDAKEVADAISKSG